MINIYGISWDLLWLDVAANSWSAKNSEQFGLSAPIQANVVDGKIFVLYGLNSFMYDPVADSWTDKDIAYLESQ